MGYFNSFRGFLRHPVYCSPKNESILIIKILTFVHASTAARTRGGLSGVRARASLFQNFMSNIFTQITLLTRYNTISYKHRLYFGQGSYHNSVNQLLWLCNKPKTTLNHSDSSFENKCNLKERCSLLFDQYFFLGQLHNMSIIITP